MRQMLAAEEGQLGRVKLGTGVWFDKGAGDFAPFRVWRGDNSSQRDRGVTMQRFFYLQTGNILAA